MKIEIEVPPPPEGYRVDGYRYASRGDLILNYRSAWELWEADYLSTIQHIVAATIRPRWTPPPELVKVLRPGWIARDNSGEVWLHASKPKRDNVEWLSGCFPPPFELCDLINPAMLPPDTIPWDECCFQIGEASE